MGRDAIGRTEAQVIGTSPIEHTAIEREEELFTVNMGPHHPATHGVLRLLVSLEGEVVRDLKPVMGYVHTGIEKSCEQKSYWKVIPFVERMDYLSYYFNAEAFVGAVEKLLELEIPPPRQVAARRCTWSSTGSARTSSGSARRRSTSARCRCSGTASASATRSST